MPSRIRISSVSERIETALAELRETDQPSAPVAGLGFTPAPSITKDEAATAPSPLARQAWSAGSTLWAEPYQTHNASGWVRTFSARHQLTFQDLENLKNQALRVLVSITPVGSDEVPQSAFEELPAKVQAYWDSTFKPGSLMAEQRDALVALIRAAAADKDDE